jgi:mannitol-1-phosphate 5-dehydrogenase
MNRRTFVGFGFGAIQAGLFLDEAVRSGAFGRLVVAEVVPEVVASVRAQGGECRVNVATEGGIEVHALRGIELLNPRVPADRAALVAAVAEAGELATALPSVDIYEAGPPGAAPADVLAEGLRRRVRERPAERALVYTAENHNHAAERLAAAVRRRSGGEAAAIDAGVQFLNTVIGKMSGVVTDPAQIRDQGLAPVCGDAGRAFLVEAFNRILVTRVRWPDFERGITVFEERDDLLPFEEAKLYGHNAVHALLGYLAQLRGVRFMADIAGDPALLALGRAAFLEESGAALCRKHGGVDPLFTPDGYRAYADDLLRRMTNPHLRDAVERVTRDPLRKLGWDDRLVGTMRLALGQGIRPARFACGAAAARRLLLRSAGPAADDTLAPLWRAAGAAGAEAEAIRALILEADAGL